jgi:hypothetical protein
MGLAPHFFIRGWFRDPDLSGPVGVQPKPQQVSGWLHGHRWGFRELRGLWLWEAKGEACAEGGWITCSTGGC